MSTSLAEQLQRLAVPQTSKLKQNDRKRASILFDAREAADISEETVYQIGSDGFEELKAKNPIFSTFDNTLFHITAKSFQRSVQTGEANEMLNKRIKQFFHLLSPYFLTNAAHKALEWLVYRYHIQAYNRDELILLILPYHDTNIFVRVLQIIEIKDNDRWLWLKLLQKPGIHLSKQVLYNQAASNPGFLQLLSDNLLSAIEEHEQPNFLTIQFNFYCATFTGGLENAKTVDENHVVHMLPSIVKGLKSEIPDFCASAYIILSKLLTKVTLSDKVLDLLMEKLTMFNVKMLKTEGILVMIVLYQSNENYKEMPVEAIKNLAGQQWLGESLRELGDSGCLVDTLLRAVFNSGIKIALEEVSTTFGKTLIDALINVLKLSDNIVHEIIQILTKSYDLEMFYPSETSTWLKTLVETIERQYPATFDKEVTLLMKDADRRKAFQNIIQNVDFHNQVDLLQKLYHPQNDIRKSALKNLLKRYKKLKDREQEFLRNVFVDRLQDDNSEVIRETLEIPDKILLNVLDKKELKNILVKLLYMHKFEKIAKNILEKLLKIDEIGEDYEVLIAFFPYLMPAVEETKKYVSLPLFENFIKKFQALKPLQNCLNDKKFNDKLKEVRLDVNIMLQTVKESAHCKDPLFISTIALLFCQTSTDFDHKIIPILVDSFKKSDVKLVKDKSASNSLELSKQKLSLRHYLNCVEHFFEKCPKNSLNSYDFSENSEMTQSYLLLINFLLSGCFHPKTAHVSLYARTFKKFMDIFAPKVEIEFLLNYASCNNMLVSFGNQLRALKSVQSLLNESKTKITNKDNLLPYLIIRLQSDFAEIRKVALQCLELLTNVKNYSSLVKVILEGQQEILQDSEQVSQIICNGKSQISSTINLLVNKLGDNVPFYLKSGIITAVSKLEDLAIFQKIVKYALTVFPVENKFSPVTKLINDCIEQFTVLMAKSTTQNSDLCKFITTALKQDTRVEIGSPSISILMLNKIDKEMYNHFPNEVQTHLLQLVIEIATYSENHEMLPAATKVFKHIDLDTLTILDLLHKMRDVISPKQQSRLRRRISVVPTTDILDSKEWKMGTTVLEFIQDKKKMRNIDKLIPVLFDILKKCLDFDEQSSVEYPKQLLLSSILHYCDKIDPTTLPQNVFNMELVVQCIRASQNPQTHHHALLLLAKVASFIPNQVLLHIMAIFTFMGSSVLRHDDAYSFQIISKIIQTIIPILIQEKSKNNIINVLRVFVDVILDVPEHRRMPLYRQLLEQIGPKDNLHIFLLLIFEAHVLAQNKDGTKRPDIAKELCLEFSAEVVIFTSIQLIEYVKSLPIDKENSADQNLMIFDVKKNTPKQFRHYKYTLVIFTASLLASKDFVNRVARVNDDENENLEELYKKMIINILTYIQITSKVVEQNANTPQAQYWKVMLHHTYDILDSLNALLTPQMFLLVVKGLMTHQLNTVKRRALELLNTKLQHNQDFFDDCEQTDLYAMIPPLLVIINEAMSENLDSDEEIIIQTALLSLKLFVRLLAGNDPQKFVNILNFVTDLIKAKIDPNIMASAILCLAELCTNLRSHSIAALNKFMPVIIKILKSQSKEQFPTLLLLSAVTTLQKILEVLSLFLSPYLEKLVYEICNLTSKWHANDETNAKTAPFVTKMANIREKLGTSVPPRVLIPAIGETYKTLVDKKNYIAVGPLMDILSESLGNLQGPELQHNLPELTTFFLVALEFRSVETTVDASIVTLVEGNVIKALTNLILKLSESSFRPLYYKVYDWAVRTQGQGKSDKIITFYAFSCAVANALKGLFVLFAGHFLNNAASILDACNTKSEIMYFNQDHTHKNIELLENTLKTINLVFLYDSQKFINKDRFDMLMQPIVDQLDNTLGDYQTRVRDIVIPTIVNFTVATADDALWKQLNYQILLKMRDVNPKVRMLALECLRDICKKVGEDFLPLLPETIPFLAELLEDEEETIEKACQQTIQELEKVLGEPLQKYF